MKKKLINIIVIVLLIVGLSLLLYPSVSDYLRSLAYYRTITEYQAEVEALDEEIYEDMLAAARDYNVRLAAKNHSLAIITEEELTEYENLLNVGSDGLMGYVAIPKIEVSLPIYHGTSDAVLQSGVGHLEGSSLPVGGEGTHTVLSAHRGLPSAKLFTSIDQLVEGDIFRVHVLKEILTYEVDDIQTVLPQEVGSIRINPEQDYCTLLTCTPYGVNTHRLLVRGHRIETVLDENDSDVVVPQIKPDWLRQLLTVLFPLLILMLIILIIWKMVKRRKSRQTEQEEVPEEKSGQDEDKKKILH